MEVAEQAPRLTRHVAGVSLRSHASPSFGHACLGRGRPVLDLVGIGQSPSHPLDKLSRKMVAFEVAWDHPLLKHDGLVASIWPICGYENSWHREPPSVVGVPMLAGRPWRPLKAG